MLSLMKAYVITAKTKFDTPKPKSFEAHNSFVAVTIFFAASQKHIPMGTAKRALDKNILSSHHSHTNCALN
jgi:hypothetical protein